MSTDAIEVYDGPGPLTPAQVVQQVGRIQEVMDAVMRDGEHYGRIPGCGDRPALLQPGAQVLALTFRLAPSFEIDERFMDGGHREYLTKCSLTSINTGQVVGSGAGSCSTMESKYRYRNVSDYTILDDPIPNDAKERKAEYRKQGFGMKKVDGVWFWVKYTDAGKTENPDIADTYNTVLKMSLKRAFVGAVLNTLAASDMFTQDIEDLPDFQHEPSHQLQPEPPAATPPADTPAAAPLASKKALTELRKLTSERLSRTEADLLKTVKKRYGHETIEALTAAECEEITAAFTAIADKKRDEVVADLTGGEGSADDPEEIPF